MPSHGLPGKLGRVLAALVLSALVVSCGARQARVEALPEVPESARPREVEPAPHPEPKTVHAPRRYEPASPVVHVVRKGETLWRIARSYDLPLAELAAANGIDDPTRIRSGQRLVIPGAVRPVSALPAAPPLASSAASWSWPVVGPISSRFGARRPGSSHKGIDILVPGGTPVLAARDGRVIFSGRRGAYGYLVVVQHDDGFASWYAHNSANLVQDGVRVRRGDVIARSGASGNATAPHVHFELHRSKRPLDPLVFLPPL
ncbi:MAG: LysM peptidoglycan-binding domain-containing M23 family metallopeptidase [Acidobacteriota bacterium]|nr:LysM peptidoglycan-binding domain-containing M23 family metallopeptidase [Acidobacteriota bacterium]